MQPNGSSQCGTLTRLRAIRLHSAHSALPGGPQTAQVAQRAQQARQVSLRHDALLRQLRVLDGQLGRVQLEVRLVRLHPLARQPHLRAAPQQASGKATTMMQHETASALKPQ